MFHDAGSSALLGLFSVNLGHTTKSYSIFVQKSIAIAKILYNNLSMIETPMQAYERRAAKQRVLDAARDARYAAHDAEMSAIRQSFDAATKRAHERGDFSAKPLQQAAAKIGDGIAERAKAREISRAEEFRSAEGHPGDHHVNCNCGLCGAKPAESRKPLHPKHAAASDEVARKLARVMERRGMSATDARLAGGHAPLTSAERHFRATIAVAAGCKTYYSRATDEWSGHIPSDRTWEAACKLLAEAEVTK